MSVETRPGGMSIQKDGVRIMTVRTIDFQDVGVAVTASGTKCNVSIVSPSEIFLTFGSRGVSVSA